MSECDSDYYYYFDFRFFLLVEIKDGRVFVSVCVCV